MHRRWHGRPLRGGHGRSATVTHMSAPDPVHPLIEQDPDTGAARIAGSDVPVWDALDTLAHSGGDAAAVCDALGLTRAQLAAAAAWARAYPDRVAADHYAAEEAFFAQMAARWKELRDDPQWSEIEEERRLEANTLRDGLMGLTKVQSARRRTAALTEAHAEDLPADTPVAGFVHLVRNPEIMGGAITIRGTRLTARAVQARLAGGDALDSVIRDYDYIARAAIEEAARVPDPD